MYDPGLKDYMYIQEPYYETDDRLPPDEWQMERDKCLRLIFAHVLEIQRELEIQLWFSWNPHVSSVDVSTYNEDAKWHSGEDNKIYFIVSADYLDEDMDPGEWASKIIHKLNKWADKFYEEHS